MSARERHLQERRLKVGLPIGAYRAPEEDLPSLGEFLGGLGLMLGLAFLVWLLSFAPQALQAVE